MIKDRFGRSDTCLHQRTKAWTVEWGASEKDTGRRQHLWAGHEFQGFDQLVPVEAIDGNGLWTHTDAAARLAPEGLVTKEVDHQCGAACSQPGRRCSRPP